MVERGAKQRAALQAARELPGELLHSSDRGQLRHVFAQHVKVFEQQRALVLQRWLKRFKSIHSVFYLPKDPRIRHRAATNQNSITTGFFKSIERLFDRHYVAASRNR